jgi:hypothetical protein
LVKSTSNETPPLTLCNFGSDIPKKKHYQYRNSYTSPYIKVEHGVPKESVLGPLLFFLCINDLTENVKGAKLAIFADDTNLLVTAKD